MKKRNKLLLTGLTGLTILAPVATVVSCGFGGGAQADPQSYTQKDMAKQLEDEKAVPNPTADKTNITLAIRGDELDVYEKAAALFNKYKHGHVKVSVMQDPGDMDNAYKKYDAIGNVKTITIANADVIGHLIAGKSHYAKPIELKDFLSADNSSLYNVFEGEKSFKESDVQSAHLKIDSNIHDVQFGFPVGYTATALYANWRILSAPDGNGHSTVDQPIYAWVPNPNDNGDVTMIDEKGNPISDEDTDWKNKAVRLSDHTTYDSIQAILSGAGWKPEDGKTIVTDPHHSVPVGNWIGYGPSNMSQRIFSIGYSVAHPNGALHGTHSLALKESFGGFPYLASSGLTDKVDGPMYDTKTSTLLEKGFDAQITTNGFSDKLAKYFWNAFGGYMNKFEGSFINHKGLPNDGVTGEVEPFEYHQTIFMQNALWAEKLANSNWHATGNGGYKNDGKWADDNHMLDSGDVVKFSLPYGEVSGDSYIISHTASTAETLVAKRFLKFMEQTGDETNTKANPMAITYTPNEEAQRTEPVGMAIAHKFTSAFSNVEKLQEKEITGGLGTKPTGHTPNDGTRADDAYRIYASALKQTQYGNKAENTPSDEYNGITGTIWTKDDNNFYALMKAQLMQKLQYFKNNDKGAQGSGLWTYDQFKAALKEAAVAYYSEKSLK